MERTRSPWHGITRCRRNPNPRYSICGTPDIVAGSCSSCYGITVVVRNCQPAQNEHVLGFCLSQVLVKLRFRLMTKVTHNAETSPL